MQKNIKFINSMLNLEEDLTLHKLQHQFIQK